MEVPGFWEKPYQTWQNLLYRFLDEYTYFSTPPSLTAYKGEMKFQQNSLEGATF